MEKTKMSIFVFVILAFVFSGFTLGDKAPSVYEFQVKDIDGHPVDDLGVLLQDAWLVVLSK